MKQIRKQKKPMTGKKIARNTFLVFVGMTAVIFAAITLRIAVFPMGDIMNLKENLVQALGSAGCAAGIYVWICSYQHRIAA